MTIIFTISVILVGIGIFGFLLGSIKPTNGVDFSTVTNVGIYSFIAGMILGIIGVVWYLLILLK